MEKRFIFIAFLLLCIPSFAQRTEAEIKKDIHNLSGIYTSYPDTAHVLTPAPKGYRPFYISHLGRHGSRYHTSAGVYGRCLEWLEKGMEEGKLTATGKEVYDKVRTIAEDAKDQYGSLTPRGAREHRHIAERMFRNFPEVFRDKDCEIDVYSSTVGRCIISMTNSIERLKELNPSIKVTRTCSDRLMKNLFHIDECRKLYAERKGSRNEGYRTQSNPERLLNLLFTDYSFIPEEKRWDVLYAHYILAAICSDVDYLGIDLYDYLTVEECYPLWQVRNNYMYMESGPSEANGAKSLSDADDLLRHFIMNADAAIAGGKYSATLRYAHDQNVVPLAGLMGIEGCCTPVPEGDGIHDAWCDYVVTPMAANIQMIFYRKKGSEDVLVKILMNEKESLVQLVTDCAPYYRWTDLREYFMQRLAAFPAPSKSME
ncbi:MAG: histidine phosphatase family protein [Clostridium sp.]|nr:histidine phosphatase family protein [Bacteroides sp.]MCM1197384.1 histidine phosphatase family protein [Clostridium sp.]